jgi:hypothetical protein
MEHYLALFSIVCMIAFVATFDLRHRRQRLRQLWGTITLLSTEELDQIRMIWAACEEV